MKGRGEGRRGSTQFARRVRRFMAIACLCSSPAISHLAGEPDPALLVPTDNWTNHSHSLRANYSSRLLSSFLPLFFPSLSSSWFSSPLSLSLVSLVDMFSNSVLFLNLLVHFACSFLTVLYFEFTISHACTQTEIYFSNYPV